MGLFLEEAARAFRPRVLELVFDGSADGVTARREEWRHPDPALDALGGLSGGATALAWVFAAVDAGDAPPALAVAVGSAVRRGLPTAARATVAGVAPLTGGWAESQVGGGFAERLVGHADLCVLRGARSPRELALLVVDAEGAPRLVPAPELAELPLSERCAALREGFPAASGLVVGPAAARGVRFASLATLEDPPSFTGRGGLGARLGELGLVALLVEGEVAPRPEAQGGWSADLASSPSLRTRGTGGTFELLDAFAARGDAPADPARRRTFADTLAQRQSCPGCPTACRHVLKSAGGGRVAARFSATFPLGAQLGIERAEDELALLEVCNDVGVDAGEMGATLAVFLQHARELRGDVAGLAQAIRGIGHSSLRFGAADLARVGGAAGEGGAAPIVRTAKGGAVRAVSDLAALLGQCVSARGSDPMRAFPFLAESGGDTARLARLVAPLELPAGAFDPRDPAGKGRLVWWHENLANVLDAAGFCAFSAAGLLGDGYADLDDLAGWLELPGLVATGEALVAAGASLVLLQRRLGERLGASLEDVPAWARGELDRPGGWDEYRLLRGLEPDGRVGEAALAAFATPALAQLGFEGLPAVTARVAAPSPPLERTAGAVVVRAAGSLGQMLGMEGMHPLQLPATVGGLLRELAGRHPDAAAWLWRDGDSAVSVWRAARRLAPDELVRDGDRIDLVVAIGGG